MYNEQNIKRLPQSKFEVVEILGYPKNDNNIPAATAEPITPATFGPMACINRKFPGFASCPTFCDTRAAIGTAETPAEPINGLILFLVNKFMNFASNTPPALPILKARTPISKMANVCKF